MQDHVIASFGPGGEVARCSEGAFIRLRDGRILFVYSQFRHSFHDNAASDLVACYSSDEGETFSEPELFLPASLYGVRNVMSVSLMRMENGDLGLFYLVKHPEDGTNSYHLSRSRDEGKTFYKHVPVSLPDRRAFLVVNNDRVVRLSTGRILVPIAFHRSGVNTEGKWYFDYHGYAAFLYSDDDGETWRESRDIVYPPFTHSETGLQEPGVIELRNGALYCYCRTDKLCQYEFYSMDGGNTFTTPQPSRFSAPDSPLHIVRRPDTGALIAIWNPIPKYNGRETTKVNLGRTPFVFAQSTDEGTAWSEPRVIEDHPEHGYCYPAVFFPRDGAMLLAYCAGGLEDGLCLARLTIKKIAL